MEPYFTVGIFSAQRIASSRSLHSSRKYPPSCSCVSAKGPSVINVLPSRMRTLVALEPGATPLVDTSTEASFVSLSKACQAGTSAWISSEGYTFDSLAYISNKYFMSLVSSGGK